MLSLIHDVNDERISCHRYNEDNYGIYCDAYDVAYTKVKWVEVGFDRSFVGRV